MKTLQDEYGVKVNVQNLVDVGKLAVVELTEPSLQRAGIMKIARSVLFKDFENDRLKEVNKNCDKPLLSEQQVMYGVIGSYLCFDIGRQLSVWLPLEANMVFGLRSRRVERNPYNDQLI
ncbi:hypothetical protein L2E82_05688 [Cichorium intybus]|uniref:Uncharacterized protein n=1 Tax=Cichorium intybus TaxID=13427 RepID=A0ACB9H9I1_CICIN|nr:hypothetical protein L2E82_05688 [Cichorium intybus]